MVHVDVTRVSVSVLPLDHRERGHFEITVEWRGDGRWAVMHVGFALGSDGVWDYEPSPSAREDGWLETHRFGYDEAVWLATATAPLTSPPGRTSMSELKTEPDGPEAFVLIGEAPLQVLLVRDDAAATEGEPERRWFVAHDGDIEGLTWGQIAEPDPAEQVDYLPAGLTRDTRVVMVPEPEVQRRIVAAVVDGGYEDLGGHRIALGAGRCVIHGEHYEPHELDRLRGREAGRGE